MGLLETTLLLTAKVALRLALVSLRLTRRSLRTFDLNVACHERSWRFAEGQAQAESNGAGNGIRTRDFDLGKVALYH